MNIIVRLGEENCISKSLRVIFSSRLGRNLRKQGGLAKIEPRSMPNWPKMTFRAKTPKMARVVMFLGSRTPKRVLRTFRACLRTFRGGLRTFRPILARTFQMCRPVAHQNGLLRTFRPLLRTFRGCLRTFRHNLAQNNSKTPLRARSGEKHPILSASFYFLRLPLLTEKKKLEMEGFFASSELWKRENCAACVFQSLRNTVSGHHQVSGPLSLGFESFLRRISDITQHEGLNLCV